MKPNRLVLNALHVAELNSRIGWWDPSLRNPEDEARWQEMTENAKKTFDAWFELLASKGPGGQMDEKTEAAPRQTFGDYVEPALKIGETRIWAQSETIQDPDNETGLKRTVWEEALTRRWIYYETPAPEDFNRTVGQGGTKYIKQVLVGTHDVEIPEHAIGGQNFPAQELPADSIDVITSFFPDADSWHEGVTFEVVRPITLERTNLDNPVFEDENEGIFRSFDDDMPYPYEYRSPYELFVGVQATLDELNLILSQSKGLEGI